MLVIFDKKPRKGGVKEYLQQGTRGDRNTKDKRVALVGDLNIAEKAYKLAQQKGYKETYRNIVLSFEEDNLPIDQLQRIAEDFIKLYMRGYRQDEYVAYAEAHLPKRKLNSKGEIRKPHIHIVIPTFSPKLRHRLDLGDHARRLREIELIKELIETKYNLQSLTNKRVIQPNKSEILEIEKYKTRTEQKRAIENYIYANIQHYRTLDDLIEDLAKKLKAQINRSKNAKTPYISIKLPNANRAIRLKGELFGQNFLQAKKAIIEGNRKVKLPTAPRRSLQEVAKELRAVQIRRIERIVKRIKYARKKAKHRTYAQEAKERIQNYLSYAERELKKIYLTEIPLPTKKGFFVRKYENTGYTIVVNKKRDIKIIDKGNKIVAQGKNLEEQAKIMIEMALAKGWDLAKVRVNGSEEFKKIAKELIKQKLKELERPLFPNASLEAVKKERIDNPISSKLQEAEQERKTKELDLKTLKEVLTAEALLQELEQRGFIPKGVYEIENNRILVGKKKLNIVDFCLKELNLSFKDTSKLLNDVYNANLQDFKGDNMQEQATKVDWSEIKRTLHPITIAKYYKIELKPEQVSKKKEEYRIKVDRRNYNVIDYLLKERGLSFKQIANDIEKLLAFQRELARQEELKRLEQIRLAEQARRAQEQREREEALEAIREAKKEDLSIFLANLGYMENKRKSSRNYRVMESEQGDKVIVYRKGDKYLYFNPQDEQDKGDLYNFFANRGVKNYKEIANFIKGADRNIGLKPLQEAKHSYAIDRALTEWERYREKEENDYSYLTDKRFLAKEIVEAYGHTIKSDKQGNIVVPLYANVENIKLAFVGLDRRLKEPKEGQPKSYISGQKGIAILQPKEIAGIKNVVIAESYIDGLSYVEYQGLEPNKTAIISTQGQVSDKSVEAIKTYLQTVRQKGANIKEIDLAMDNDRAGKEFAERLEKELKQDVRKKELFYAKDWNEELIRRKINKAVELGEIDKIEDKELRERAERIKQEKIERERIEQQSGSFRIRM